MRALPTTCGTWSVPLAFAALPGLARYAENLIGFAVYR